MVRINEQRDDNPGIEEVMKAEIYETIDHAWVVECCEPENDGICHKAIFYGPDAETHARDHMQLQFGEVAPVEATEEQVRGIKRANSRGPHG